jgi:hypothetical protein
LLELQQKATEGKLKRKLRTECAKNGCPGRFRNFGAAKTKPLFFSPPKRVTWNMTVGTVAGGKKLISQGFMEEQTKIVDRIIAFNT